MVELFDCYSVRYFELSKKCEVPGFRKPNHQAIQPSNHQFALSNGIFT